MGLKGSRSTSQRFLETAKRYVTRRSLTIVGAALVAVLVSNAYAHNNLTLNSKAYADGQHLVNVYVDGQTTTVASSAATVQSALDQLHIKLGKGDVVEPAITTTINQPSFNINVYRALPATILDDGKRIQILTGYQSPRQIATAAGLTVYPEDIITMTRANNLALDQSIGREVTITRAKPVQVVLAGQVYNFRTQKAKVSELFAEKGLAINASDVINIDLNGALTPGMRIVVNRLSQTITQVKVAIPSTVSYQYDANQLVGYTAVKQAGKDGVKLVSYLVNLTNGAETGRSVLEEKVIEPATDKVIVKGSKVVVVATSDAVATGERMAAAKGWTGEQWLALYQLWNRESGWNPSSQNGGSGACGIPQAYPCSKLGSAFPGNVEGQISWGLNYIAAKYGTPTKAWAYWLGHGSY